MKKSLLRLILAIPFLFSLPAFGQQDSVGIQPQPSSPQGQYGTQRMPADPDAQKEDRVEVEKSKLPPAMQDALGQDAKYEGWEDVPVFYEKNTDQYMLHLIKDNSTQTFRFDKEGMPVHTDQPVEGSEKNH